MDNYTSLKTDFANKIEDVKDMFRSRIQESVQQLFKDELSQLEEDTNLNERNLDILESFINDEKSCIEMAEAIDKSLKLQKGLLDYISNNLPEKLPSLGTNQQNTNINSNLKEGITTNLNNVVKKFKAPRKYITSKELESISSYMKGRLTLDKVNKALDELAEMGEANAKLIHQIKSKKNVLSIAERKKALEILNSVSREEGVSGKYFVTENDLKGSKLIKSDNTGKALITLLRHLGRIQEVRVCVDNINKIVYVLT